MEPPYGFSQFKAQVATEAEPMMAAGGISASNTCTLPIGKPAEVLRLLRGGARQGVSSVALIPESARRGEESSWAARKNREW